MEMHINYTHQKLIYGILQDSKTGNVGDLLGRGARSEDHESIKEVWGIDASRVQRHSPQSLGGGGKAF